MKHSVTLEGRGLPVDEDTEEEEPLRVGAGPNGSSERRSLLRAGLLLREREREEGWIEKGGESDMEMRAITKQ